MSAIINQVKQYQDNQGDICLLFFCDENGLPYTHYLKLSSSGNPVISTSVNTNAYYSPALISLTPWREKLLIEQFLNYVGGESEFKNLIKNGKPTKIALSLPITAQ